MNKPQIDALFKDIDKLLRSDTDEWHVSHGAEELANYINNTIYEHWWCSTRNKKPFSPD